MLQRHNKTEQVATIQQHKKYTATNAEKKQLAQIEETKKCKKIYIYASTNEWKTSWYNGVEKRYVDTHKSIRCYRIQLKKTYNAINRKKICTNEHKKNTF